MYDEELQVPDESIQTFFWDQGEASGAPRETQAAAPGQAGQREGQVREARREVATEVSVSRCSRAGRNGNLRFRSEEPAVHSYL